MYKALLTLALAAAAVTSGAQTITQPAPFPLNSGNYQFSTWSPAQPAGTYPANMRFYRLDVTTDPAETNQIYTDYDTAYNLTTGTRLTGQADNGFSFLNTSTAVNKLGAAVLSLNTTSRTSITLSWKGRTITPNNREYEIRMYYRTGNTGAWTTLISGVDTVRYVRSATAGDSLVWSGVVLPTALENKPEVQLMWKYFLTAANTAASTRSELAVDDISVTSSGAAFPILTTSANTLTTFASRPGGVSTTDSLTVNGSLLTGNITVTAPANFEVSLNNATFSNSVTLAQTGGTVSNAKVYVRFAPTASGTFTTNLILSTPGSAGMMVGISGYTIQSTNPPAFNLSSGSYSMMMWDSLAAPGTYPANMMFHVTNDIAAPRTLLPLINDWTCSYNVPTRPRINGLDSMGIGFVNTGSPQYDFCDTLTAAITQNIFVGASVLALKTTGMGNMTLSFNAGQVSRDTAVANPVKREYSLRAQWRTDTNAAYQDFSPAVAYTTTGRMAGDLQSFSTPLPTAMNNKPYVQVRWLYHSENIGGASGQRPAIRMDNVTVSGMPQGVSNVNLNGTQTAYPNPLNAGETLSFKEAFTGDIYDGFGRKIATLRNATQCATSGWASGIYYLKSTNNTLSNAKNHRSLVRTETTKIFAGLALMLVAAGCVKDRIQPAIVPNNGNQKTLHYWNFDGSATPLIPTSTVGGGAITVSSTYDTVNAGTTLNALNSDDSGAALRVRNPSDNMVWKLPTTGYKSPTVSFALMRSSSGPQSNLISYTTDGTNYRTDSLDLTTVTVGVTWQLIVLDFSKIASCANNPAFAVKINFSNGNTGATGNDRYDNLLCAAEPMATAPVPSRTTLHRWAFNSPSTDMAVFTQPTNTIGGGMLTYSAAWDTSATGTTLNVVSGGAAGNALKLKNPSGNFTITAPTTGYKNVLLKFATERNSTGPQTQTIAYSLDGTAFTSASLTPYTVSAGTDYAIAVFDLSAIPNAPDNANFKVRISYTVGNGNPAGYTLMDNISVEGDKK